MLGGRQSDFSSILDDGRHALLPEFATHVWVDSICTQATPQKLKQAHTPHLQPVVLTTVQLGAVVHNEAQVAMRINLLAPPAAQHPLPPGRLRAPKNHSLAL